MTTMLRVLIVIGWIGCLVLLPLYLIAGGSDGRNYREPEV